jgi:glycosyltransferase involved in cell wall biosynthesis
VNDRVHLVTIGGHRWLSPPEAQELDFRVAQGLAERLGGEHHVIARAAAAQTAGVDRRGAVTVHRLDNESAWSFARRARGVTRTLAASLNAPVVVTTSDVAGALAMWRAPAAISVVAQVQGSVLDPGHEYGSAAKRFAIRTTMRTAVRRANAVRALNATIAEQARAAGARGPIGIIGSRVDVEQFSPANGHATRGRRVGTVGGLLPVKNQAVLVEAMADLVHEYPDVELVLVGDGPLRSTLVDRARRLGVDAHVKFTGSIPHREVVEVLRSLAVYAQPSFSEGEPRALLEAQAVELPAVVSDIPAHRGIVDDGQTALVVAADDAAAWAKAFRRLFDDCSLGSELGSTARARVVREHEFDALLDRFAAFLRSAARSA